MKAIADNSQLLRLAGEQSQPVFRILDRAGAMTPLVVVLAALPGLFALYNYAPNDLDALWALRGLGLLSAEHVDEFLDPAAGSEASLLAWQPPLASWLTALSLWLWGPSRPWSLELFGYVSTAALVGMVYVLLRTLADSRVAFWSACLTACHAHVLKQSQTPQPHALAVLLAVFSIWLWWRHLEAGIRMSSYKVVLAGVAFGLSVLAGGMFGLAVAVVVCFALLVALMDIDVDSSAASVRRRRKRAWRGLAATCLLLVVGLVVAGWWFAFMWDRHGMDFVAGWLSNPRSTAGADVAASTAAVAPGGVQTALDLGARLMRLLGPMVGAWIVAVPLALRESIWGHHERTRRWLQFVLAWMASALLLWGCWWRFTGRPDVDFGGWSLFLLVPCVAVTAYGIDAMSRRRCAAHWTLAAAVAAAGVCLASGLGLDDVVSRASWTAVAAGFLAAWLFGRFFRVPERRQHALVAASVLLVVSASALEGLRSVSASHKPEPALSELHGRLAALGDVETCLFVSAQTPPPRLRYVLESFDPRATSILFRTRSEALDALRNRPRSNWSNAVVVVEWGPPENTAKPQESALAVEPLFDPAYFEQSALQAWTVVPPAGQDST